MTTTHTVRQLDRPDAKAWAALRLEALTNHPLAFGSSVPDDPNSLVESMYSKLDPSAESTIFGAFADSLMVGIVGISRATGQKERHKAWIWGMYVSAKNRRAGIGEMLIRAAIDLAQSDPEIELIHLDCSEVATAARSLYERVGFKVWGREPRSLLWEGRYVDEIHLVMDLR
jgi:RimJ/RimL family protein N-acetyltransferase